MTTRPDDPVHPAAGGLTKREHFAALAMAAAIAAERRRPLEDQSSLDDLAIESVIAADALIDALNEEPQR